MDSKEYKKYLQESQLKDVTSKFGINIRTLDLAGLSADYPMVPFTSLAKTDMADFSKKYNLQVELNRFYNYFIWPAKNRTLTLGDIGRDWFPSKETKERYKREDAAAAKVKADWERAKAGMTRTQANKYTLDQYKRDIISKQTETKAQLEAQLANASPADRAAIAAKLAAANSQYANISAQNNKNDGRLKVLVAKMGRIKGKIDIYNRKDLKDSKSRAKVRAWIAEYDATAKEGKVANFAVMDANRAQEMLKVRGALNYQTAVNQVTSGNMSLREAFDGFDIGDDWIPSGVMAAIAVVSPIGAVFAVADYIDKASKRAGKLEETIISESSQVDTWESAYQSIPALYDPTTMPYSEQIQMTDARGNPVTATRMGDQIILPTGSGYSETRQYDASIIKQEGDAVSAAGKTGDPAGSGRTLMEQIMNPTTLLIVGGAAVILLLVMSSGKKSPPQPQYYPPQ